MYSKMTTSVVDFICEHTKSDEETREIYSYGLEIILINILNTIITLVLATITNHLFETIILIVAFYPLQSFGGGYHAQTHFRCLSIFLIGWVLAMLAIPYIKSSDFLIFILALTGTITIFLLAPIEHVNFPMSSRKKYKMKSIVRSIASLLFFMTIIFDTILECKIVSAVLSVALIWSGLSMLSAFIRQSILQKRSEVEDKI